MINRGLKAFNLGNIISDKHNIEGNNILPNPPINIGIIIKSIINIPWKLILELYWGDGGNINPGRADSDLVIEGKPRPGYPPINPDII